MNIKAPFKGEPQPWLRCEARSPWVLTCCLRIFKWDNIHTFVSLILYRIVNAFYIVHSWCLQPGNTYTSRLSSDRIAALIASGERRPYQLFWISWFYSSSSTCQYFKYFLKRMKIRLISTFSPCRNIIAVLKMLFIGVTRYHQFIL